MIALALMLLCAEPEASADAEVQRAVELFRAFKVPDGIKVLGRALARAQLPASERARVYVYVAIGEANRGDDAASRRALEQAFAYDAAVELPDIASPKTRALYGKLKPKVEAPAPAVTALPVPKPAEPAVVVEPQAPLVIEKAPEGSKWWVVPAVLSVAGAAASAVLFQQSESRFETLNATGVHITVMQREQLVGDGKTFQTTGWITALVAAACVIAAVLLGLLAG